MSLSRKLFGTAGEVAAREFLERRGMIFVAANVQTRFDELDLVMRDGSALAFVEVKARRTDVTGHPAEAITPTKLRHLVAGAQSYIQTHGHHGPWRVDVVSIQGGEIGYLQNVTGLG